ncbi:unnamed protein product [Adineta ricciae]|uniref:Uncharacterized protein n=1 Tax=Adineta ricciae TaxID=249248 RepID=A0A815MUR2_ADIRI|nr:unnamed protein product [Adineta ricciae]
MSSDEETNPRCRMDENDIRALSESQVTLRKEVDELKVLCKVLQSEIHSLRDQCAALRSENQQFREKFQQVESRVPLQSMLRISNINVDTEWVANGIVVAGASGPGSAINQLWEPYSVCIDDDDQTIYISDCNNHRVIAWNLNTQIGHVVAGGNGKGIGANQLNSPRNAILDKKTDSLIICDYGNRRIVQWPRQNGKYGQTIKSNIECYGGFAIDDDGYLYASDFVKNKVIRWKEGESEETIVAGGNRDGNALNQLHSPTFIFVDQNRSIYVSDKDNDRVVMWPEGAKEGIIVAGGHGKGNDAIRLKYPYGIVVDRLGTVYVADSWNNRIMRWKKGAQEGSVMISANGREDQLNPLDYPIHLAFDRDGSVYVVNQKNHRILKFLIDSSRSSS